MLKIKLKPNGKIHQRSFRIVVAEDRSKSNGKFIDDLGFYTPQTKTLQIDKAKLAQWLKNGAQLTEGVDKLLNPDKYPRPVKVKKEKEVKEEIKKETEPEVEKVSAEGGSASGGEETTEVKTEEVTEEVESK
jgi:small subunit ribosomal protein S16